MPGLPHVPGQPERREPGIKPPDEWPNPKEIPEIIEPPDEGEGVGEPAKPERVPPFNPETPPPRKL